MNVPATFEVRSLRALPVPEIGGGGEGCHLPKIGSVPGYAHALSTPPKKSYAYHTDYLSLCTRFPRLWIGVLSGGCEPPILGKGRPYGVGDGTVRRSVVEFL